MEMTKDQAFKIIQNALAGIKLSLPDHNVLQHALNVLADKQKQKEVLSVVNDGK